MSKMAVEEEIVILNSEQIQGVRESGVVNTALLDFISNKLYVGMSTEEIDRLIYEETIRLGGIPATLDYNGYPKSLCTSMNDEVCHGIPSKAVKLKEGDLINIDVSTNVKGYFSDSARVFCIGEVSDDVKNLVSVAKESISVGLSKVIPGVSMKHMGRAINAFVKSNGYSVAEDIGGHGIGLKFHEEPFVSYSRRGTDTLLEAGMIFTIEPAVNMGTGDIVEDASNGWTIYTADRKPSAQWEVTVLVTETGYEILAE